MQSPTSTSALEWHLYLCATQGDRKKNVQCQLIFVLFVYLKAERTYLLSNCRPVSLDVKFHSEVKSWKEWGCPLFYHLIIRSKSQSPKALGPRLTGAGLSHPVLFPAPLGRLSGPSACPSLDHSLGLADREPVCSEKHIQLQLDAWSLSGIWQFAHEYQKWNALSPSNSGRIVLTSLYGFSHLSDHFCGWRVIHTSYTLSICLVCRECQPGISFLETLTYWECSLFVNCFVNI